MQNNSECCNNNCNQGRNCPLRAATPAADMGNPISQLNQHVAAPVLPEPEPVPTPCRSMFATQREYADAMEQHRKNWAEIEAERALLATGGQVQAVIKWQSGVGLMWDVHAFGKWLLRVVSPLNWDAHSVHQELVHAGYAEHIDVRQVHAEQGAAAAAAVREEAHKLPMFKSPIAIAAAKGE